MVSVPAMMAANWTNAVCDPSATSMDVVTGHWQQGRAASSPVDCEGQVHVITGSYSGIGWPAAVALATCKATVFLVNHDPRKSSAAAALLSNMTGNAKVYSVAVDLSNFTFSCGTRLVTC